MRFDSERIVACSIAGTIAGSQVCSAATKWIATLSPGDWLAQEQIRDGFVAMDMASVNTFTATIGDGGELLEGCVA